MSSASTRLLYLTFVFAIMFGTLPSFALAQELPGGMTKEEFCEMLKSGQRPSMPQGARPPERPQPPTGGEFQGMAPDGMVPPEGANRPERFASPNIDCGDLEGMPKTPTMQQAQPTVKPTTTAPRIPAPTLASSTREKSKLDQLIEEDAQRSFYGSETTFSNGASDSTKQNTGFFGVIVSTVASVVRNVLGWFQR